VTGGFGDRILKTVQKIDITTGLVVSLLPLIKARYEVIIYMLWG